MSIITVEKLEEKCDSMYKLVIAAARRATQISKPEIRPLVATSSKKPTTIALEEIIEGKVIVKGGVSDEDEYVE